MNDDQLHYLESQLRQLHPASLPNALTARLQTEPLEEPLTLSDRILATLTASAAIAAAIILTLVIWQLALPQRPTPNLSDLAAHQQLLAEYQSLELASR